MGETDSAPQRNGYSWAGRCWRTLLQPGVRFANRWSFTAKAVSGGAILLAIAAAGGILYTRSLAASIDATARELGALEYARLTLDLLSDLARLRVSRSGHGDGRHAAEGLAGRARALADAACPAANVRRRAHDAAERVAGLGTPAGTQHSFAAHTMLARELLACLEEAGRRSGLFGDREVDAAAFVLMRDLPVVVETVAKQGATRDVPSEELLLYAAGAQLIVTDGLERIRSVLERTGSDAQALPDPRLLGLFEAMERDLLDADGGGPSPSAADAVRDGLTFAEALIERVAEHLRRRSEHQRWAGVRTLALLAIFSGACGYMVLCTVVAIRRSLQALERGSLEFCNDYLERRIAVDSRDEFRVVAENFNRIAGRTVDLLRQLEEQGQRARRELEIQVEERTRDLFAANRRLSDTVEKLTVAQEDLVQSKKMAALGNLVAGVAHEINTPIGLAYTVTTHMQEQLRSLAAMHKAGQLRADGFAGFVENAGEGLKHAVASLERAASLIESFKQVAADQSSDVRREFDLAAYLGEITASLHSVLRKGRHLVEIAAAEKIVLDSYPGALAQVVTNIVMNAVIHGFDGRHGGTIGIATGRESKDRCSIIISDDGAGMPDKVAERVFEPFFTTRRGRGGTGLGLHIAYNLVTRRLGGFIDCISTAGKGSTFVITLPVTAPFPEGEPPDEHNGSIQG